MNTVYVSGLSAQIDDAIRDVSNSLGMEVAEYLPAEALPTIQSPLVFVGEGAESTGPAADTYTIAVLAQRSFDHAVAAMRAGFRDVIGLPTDRSEITAAISRYSEHISDQDIDDGIPTLAEMEKQAIERALTLCRGQMSMAARKLGIGRSTLYRKVELYALRLQN